MHRNEHQKKKEIGLKKYMEALQFAARLHQDQFRKGTNIPYLTHLMTVSSYVFEFGGSVDQAIAGLLHDAIEDQGDKTSYEEIENLFGAEVSRIVSACTDAETNPKPPWKQRKLEYLHSLKKKDHQIKLVVACDKLHNAQSIVKDVNLYGPEVWTRFSAPPLEITWYYEGILEGMKDFDSKVVFLLEDQVNSMKKLAKR